MDWARDNAGISNRDLDNVFKYEEKSTTVVRMLEDDKNPMIWSLEGNDEWEDWIRNECPRIGEGKSGLVLILAKRMGEPSFASVKKVPSDDWLERINAAVPGRSNIQRSMTFATMGEKLETTAPVSGANKMSGRRSVRTLPFSKDIFRLVTRKFYIHSSIARVISRADVPVFFGAGIKMEEEDGTTQPAYVYNCRTTNAWDMDLALTATYFPHCGLTFAIVFGCPLSVEEEILRRLSFAMTEAAHPLLLPGIFAELERSRQVHIVEATIDEMETRIFQLDFQSSDMERMPDSEAERRNQEKRSAWLDTTYLRNALVSWNTQLAKIRQHVDELNAEVFKPAVFENTSSLTNVEMEDNSIDASTGRFKLKEVLLIDQYGLSPNKADNHVDTAADEERQNLTGEIDGGIKSQKTRQRYQVSTIQKDPEYIKEQLRRVGQKIKDRTQAIMDEYDDKIRDCTMRVDGMAMATQWSHGETNVQIALATSRDSRHMRSIAIVTMVFLPGTFFATVFSMTFFNWFGSAGATVVSPYLWIYVLFTVFFTLLTLGSWWYFVSYRHSRRQNTTSEEEIPLV